MDTTGESAQGGAAGAAALFATIASLRPAAATTAARRVVLADLLTRQLDPATRQSALVGCLLADLGRVVLRLPPGEAPTEASSVLEQVNELRPSAEAVRHRYERVDGSGLPLGLRADDRLSRAVDLGDVGPAASGCP